MLKILGLVAVVTLTFCNAAIAGKAYSWNLSRAMMKGIAKNPRGVWAFMQNTSGIDNPINYTLLPSYSPSCFGRRVFFRCWVNTEVVQPPIIGITTKTVNWRGNIIRKGIPYLHPGENVPVILRWKSPVDGAVSIMGRITTIDPGGGEGVNWALKDKDAHIIKSGYLSHGQGSTFIAQNVAIKKEESLYFSVDMNGQVYNDSTNLDIFITNQQN